MKGALQTKTGMESVGLTPSDDLFMRDDGRRFVVVAAYEEYGNIFGYFIDRPGT